MLLGLLTFVLAHERQSVGWVLVSGVLMGLAMLVKYFGVLGICLGLAWQLLDKNRRDWKPGYLAFVVFGLVQLLWAYWNFNTYGASHFLAALPRGMDAPSLIAWAQKAIVLGSFLGGGTFF